jgi:hypothetical protein
LEKLDSYNKQEQYTGVFNIIEAIKAQFRLIGPLGQVYNIVVYIRGLARRTEEFRILVKRLILIDNYMR